MTHKVYIPLILALAFATFHFYERMKAEQIGKGIASAVLQEKTDSIRYWKNEYGQQVSQKAAAEMRTKDFEENYQQEVKQLKDELKISVKNLKAYVKAEFAATNIGTTNVIHHHYTDSAGNSIRKDSLHTNDGFLDYKADITSDTVPYKYTYQDELVYAFHKEKRWLLGNEKLYGTGRLKNPNAKIVNATNVLINDHRDKRWCVTVSGIYDPFGNTFHPGIGVGYALFKF